MPNWIEIRLTTPGAHAEVCAQFLLDAGCQGVQIDDINVLPDGEDALLVAKDEATVVSYVEDSPEVAQIRDAVLAALEIGGVPGRLELRPAGDEDWSISWRQHFPPLEIGGFLIVASWDDPPADWPAARVLRLDPGLAFGTGQHPTTRMCLEFLGEVLPLHTGARLLDVGCGSGILSIAAARLGARVTASDNDPWCTRATTENAAANGVEVKVVEAANLDWVAQPFDIVAANLMSELLIRLAPELARVTRPGGTLVTSGISQARAADVEAALQSAGFETVQRRDAAGAPLGDAEEWWSGFQMRNAECGMRN